MRILVVEDDRDLRESLVSLLKDEGYHVESAPDGIDGAYRAENWDFDAILLDVNLPGRDGLEILRRLRRSKTTPVLMLTARDGVEDRVRGLDGGADDYLTKPFVRDELLARIRAIVRRSGVEADKEITVGPVSIHTSARLATKAGEPVELTAREFDLVEILMRRRGEVISRDTLFDQLFDDEDEESISNMLDVYIYKLRRKLGRDFIRTKRGAGYFVD